MNLAASLLLCTLIAVPTYLWTSSTARGPAPADGADPGPARDAEALAALERRVAELAREHERLATAAGKLALAPAPSAASPKLADENEIAAALERWSRANGPVPVRSKDADPAGARTASELDGVPMSELVSQMLDPRLPYEDREAYFQKLREAGRIHEYVAAIEELAKTSPNDPDLQVALGNAYLQELFGADHGPEMGTLAVQADEAFARALELDETNWEARFVKAIALSNWPAFLGRGSESIEGLEILIEQQKSSAQEPHHALPYLMLGNIYQQNGDMKKAVATWRAGLELFPDHEELRAQLELAGR